MLSGRNCLILGAATLGFVIVSGGCSADGSGTLHNFNGNSNVPGSAGAPSGASGAPAGTSGAPAGTAGDPGASGAPAGTAGTPATGSAGAPAGTAGAPSTGTAGAPAGTAGTTGTAGAPAGTAGSTGTAGAGGGGTCPAPTGAHQATALDRSCWVATASDCAMTAANMNPPSGAIDASTTTRWSTGVAMSAASAYTFQVDMGSAVTITGLAFGSNNSATDFPLMLKVEVSLDATAWTPVACGSGMATTDFSFAAVSARYVRLTQSGSAATTGPGSGWWSIYDLNVYGSTATDKSCSTPGNGATGATCTTPHM